MPLNFSSLSVRARYRLALITWFVSGAILSLGAIYISEYYLIPLIITLFIVGIYTMSLKCPSCGKRVLHNPVKILGIELYIWTSWIPKFCTKCKKPLK